MDYRTLGIMARMAGYENVQTWVESRRREPFPCTPEEFEASIDAKIANWFLAMLLSSKLDTCESETEKERIQAELDIRNQSKRIMSRWRKTGPCAAKKTLCLLGHQEQRINQLKL